MHVHLTIAARVSVLALVVPLSACAGSQGGPATAGHTSAPAATSASNATPTPTPSPTPSEPASIPFPHAVEMAVDPATHVGYVTSSDGTLSKVDLATGKVALSVQTPMPSPGNVTLDVGAGTVVVSGGGDATGAVAVFNAGTLQQVGQLVSVDRGGAIAVDPGTHIAYATSARGDSGTGALLEINTVTGAFAGSIPVDPWVGSVAVDPATHTVYAAGGVGTATSPAWLVRLTPGSAPARLPVTKAPSQVVRDSTGTLYVSSRDEDQLEVVNAATGEAVASATLPYGAQFMALDPSGSGVLVAGGVDPGSVVHVDPHGVVATPRPAGFTANGVAVDSAAGTVFVIDSEHESIVVLPKQ